jgi:hypothetical protein
VGLGVGEGVSGEGVSAARESGLGAAPTAASRFPSARTRGASVLATEPPDSVLRGSSVEGVVGSDARTGPGTDGLAARAMPSSALPAATSREGSEGAADFGSTGGRSCLF